jgi:hypothetical protein
MGCACSQQEAVVTANNQNKYNLHNLRQKGVIVANDLTQRRGIEVIFKNNNNVNNTQRQDINPRNINVRNSQTLNPTVPVSVNPMQTEIYLQSKNTPDFNYPEKGNKY